MYVKNGIILADIANLEDDMQSSWYSPEKIIYGVILEDFIEAKALKKLRHPSKSRILQPYLEGIGDNDDEREQI